MPSSVVASVPKLFLSDSSFAHTHSYSGKTAECPFGIYKILDNSKAQYRRFTQNCVILVRKIA